MATKNEELSVNDLAAVADEIAATARANQAKLAESSAKLAEGIKELRKVKAALAAELGG